MSEQTTGLRFDVYERVHLPDDVAAIDELEEIELVPRIQVIDQGDHAVLKGQLLLSGVYRAQDHSDVSLTLEHWIPVEITLPMNRINRLDDISIEIDNFDVDLLSARTLNITGVLSLRGISVEPIQEQEEAWKEEPFTVVHQRETVDERLSEELINADEPTEQAYIPTNSYFEDVAGFVTEQEPEGMDEPEATVTLSSSSTDSGWSSAQLFKPSVKQPETPESDEGREITYVYSQQTYEEGWITTTAPSVEETQEEEEQEQLYEQEEREFEREPVLLAERESERAPEPEPESERITKLESPPLFAAETGQQEPRVAVTVKQSLDQSGQLADVGILTLLQTSRREQAARQAAEEIVAEQRAAEEARVQASGDEIEWKRLFLGKQSEDKDFRKIRVCIVQRDETLEVIASRYSLNTREILNHNRLDNTSLSEGQLLYIP